MSMPNKIQRHYFIDMILLLKVDMAKRESDKEKLEKHLIAILEKLLEQLAESEKTLLFEIMFGFLYATTNFNSHFSFMRKTIDVFIDSFDQNNNNSNFLLESSITTKLLLMIQEFFGIFSPCIPGKMRFQLFQYYLTKLYMARDKQNPEKTHAIIGILQPLTAGIEIKILRSVKVFSLLDNLLFNDESEYTTVFKNTLAAFFTSLVIKDPDTMNEVVGFCVS